MDRGRGDSGRRQQCIVVQIERDRWEGSMEKRNKWIH